MKSGGVSAQNRSHRRLAAFVDWIKPEADTREAIRKQGGDIRRIIAGQATSDGLFIVATPEGGSFAKHTGLRRHMRGNSEVEGLDVDLPFVIKPTAKAGEKLDELLPRFANYAANSYPNTPRDVTSTSVELSFVASKLKYDLVPMLSASQADHQIILKKDGSRRVTSIVKHTEFVRRRTRISDERSGRVKFNECVRLLKWWRFARIGTTGSIEEVRTTLIELLCASAFDRLGVEPTYTETLFKWFGWLATVTARRMPISFNDYPSIEPERDDATRETSSGGLLTPSTRTITSFTRNGATSNSTSLPRGLLTGATPSGAFSPTRGPATTPRLMTSWPNCSAIPL
jgi:hypothetical protein